MRGLPEAVHSLGRPQRAGAALLSDLAQPQEGLDDLDPQGQGSSGGPASLKIESNLPGFTEIATRAAWAAKENKLMVDRVTADNLAALGVSA